MPKPTKKIKAKVVGKPVVKKAAARKTAARKTVKPAAKKVAAKKVAAKKVAAKKVVAKKSVKVVAKTAPKKTTAKKVVAKKAPIKKAIVKQAPAKKVQAKRVAAKKKVLRSPAVDAVRSPEPSTLSGDVFPTAGRRPRRGTGSEFAGQSGDLQGLSRRETIDSESVEELSSEGQYREAEIVDAVENAPDPDEGELHTREVLADDVPEEYLDGD